VWRRAAAAVARLQRPRGEKGLPRDVKRARRGGIAGSRRAASATLPSFRRPRRLRTGRHLLACSPTRVLSAKDSLGGLQAGRR